MQLIKHVPDKSTSFPLWEKFAVSFLKDAQRDGINIDDIPYILKRLCDSGKYSPVLEAIFLFNEHSQTYGSEEKSKRKRFDKSGRFLKKEGNLSISFLSEIFQNFQLDDFREELNFWMELALCNDQSAYDKGTSREDLMEFTKELHKLIEAFHLINEKLTRLKKNNVSDRLSKQTKKLLSDFNIPVLLSKEELARPDIVIRQFCKRFRQVYAQIEILDLLDAVITYEGNKETKKTNLVLFYQHLQFLVGLSYRIVENHSVPFPKSFFKKIAD